MIFSCMMHSIVALCDNLKNCVTGVRQTQMLWECMQYICGEASFISPSANMSMYVQD